MAVVTLYMSDRDPSKTMFATKKEADEHDKKLELAAGVSHFMTEHLEKLDEGLAEEIGMLIADHKDIFSTALKGKVDAMFKQENEVESSEDDDNVHVMTKKA